MIRALRLLPLTLLVLAGNVFNVGCGSDDNARLRVVHASRMRPMWMWRLMGRPF